MMPNVPTRKNEFSGKPCAMIESPRMMAAPQIPVPNGDLRVYHAIIKLIFITTYQRIHLREKLFSKVDVGWCTWLWISHETKGHYSCPRNLRLYRLPVISIFYLACIKHLMFQGQFFSRIKFQHMKSRTRMSPVEIILPGIWRTNYNSHCQHQGGSIWGQVQWLRLSTTATLIGCWWLQVWLSLLRNVVSDTSPGSTNFHPTSPICQLVFYKQEVIIRSGWYMETFKSRKHCYSMIEGYYSKNLCWSRQCKEWLLKLYTMAED